MSDEARRLEECYQSTFCPCIGLLKSAVFPHCLFNLEHVVVVAIGAMATAQLLQIIDPMNRTGKIEIPANADVLIPTLGMKEYLGSVGQRDYSLCLLYQAGHCNAGDRCHQIHVRPEYVERLRHQAGASTCCRRHGDGRSNEPEYGRRCVLPPQCSLLFQEVNGRQSWPLCHT